MARLDIDMAGIGHAHKLAAPGPRIGAGQPDRTIRIVAAGDQNAAVRQLVRRHRRKVGQRVTVMQPKLCATNTTGPGCERIKSVNAPTQAKREGNNQSACSTRTAPGKRSAQRVCQWSGPEPFHPGTMTKRGLLPAKVASGSGSESGCEADIRLFLKIWLKTKTNKLLFCYNKIS